MLDERKQKIMLECVSIGRSAAGLICMVFILLQMGGFRSFLQTEDKLVFYITTVFGTLMLLFALLLLTSAVEHALMLRLILRDEEESGSGTKLRAVMGIVRTSLSAVMMIIMGVVFEAIIILSAVKESSSGEAEKGFMGVSVIFLLAGLGLIVSGIFQIVRSIQKH
ncbi:MAG: hypothetical protein IJ600_03565 [Lachnospiraceae bacterium]|nr:hypothetical protein [Lachnospiraceae bacterium]